MKDDAMPMTRENHHLWSCCSSFQRRRAAAAGTTTILLVVMVSILWLANATLVQSGYVRDEVTTEEFDLMARTHDEIFGIVRATSIASAFPKLECRGHPYLGAKDYERIIDGGDGTPPGRFIRVPLRGETAEDRAAIILSDSDLYVLAFENNEGTCYAFYGYERLFPGSEVLNPGGFDGNGRQWDETYNKLIEGGRKNLEKIPLGKKSELKAVRTLALYRGDTRTSSAISTALVQNIVMFPEALRFPLIRELFSGERWETETFLTERLVNYTKNWVKISVLLWNWDNDGIWPNNGDTRKLMKETGISNANDALGGTDLLRRPIKIRVGRRAS